MAKDPKKYKELNDVQQTHFKKNLFERMILPEYQALALAQQDMHLQNLMVEMNPTIPQEWKEDILKHTS